MDREKWVRVEDEIIEDESEIVKLAEELVGRVEEVVGEDEVIAKPTPPLSKEEKYLLGIYLLGYVNRKIGEIKGEISRLRGVLEVRGVARDRVEERLSVLKRRLKSLEKLRMKARVQIYVNCLKRLLSPIACQKCALERECYKALKHLERRRERKVKRFLR